MPLDAAAVYTLYDGPRLDTDVKDLTKFFINRFGAPDTVENAIGKRTVITRDAHFPMLAARVTANGDTISTTYDQARALPLTTVEVNPVLNGNATTTFKWHGTWDEVVSIVSPANVKDTIAYDPANGDRLWQQRGSNIARRVTFDVDPNTHLVTSMTTASPVNDGFTVLTSYEYDGLGNLFRTTTPRGLQSTITHDAIGRTTLVQSPVTDAGVSPQRWRFQAFTFDSLDRVLTTTDSAQKSPADLSWQMLRVSNKYDAEGNLRSTSDVMLDVMGVLSSIDDPTQRAVAGTQMLGRSYQTLAPMIGMSEDAILSDFPKLTRKGIRAAHLAGMLVDDDPPGSFGLRPHSTFGMRRKPSATSCT
jgi:YD repeat-containing protein